MGNLHQLKIANAPNVLSSSVVGVSARKLYYISTGRNAWNSTWVKQYQHGCMHLSLAGAEAFAEQHRIQGTRFTIRQLPALLVCGDDCSGILITEINTRTPLKGYSAVAVKPMSEASGPLIEKASDNYLSAGQCLVGAALSFSPDSRFWLRKPPEKDRIIMLHLELSDEAPEVLESGLLRAWSSYSVGSRYRLGWKSIPNEVSSEDVRSILV